MSTVKNWITKKNLNGERKNWRSPGSSFNNPYFKPKGSNYWYKVHSIDDQNYVNVKNRNAYVNNGKKLQSVRNLNNQKLTNLTVYVVLPYPLRNGSKGKSMHVRRSGPNTNNWHMVNMNNITKYSNYKLKMTKIPGLPWGATLVPK